MPDGDQNRASASFCRFFSFEEDLKCARISDSRESVADELTPKMDYTTVWLLLISLLSTFLFTGGVELTFELADNAKECFYQEIEKNVSCTLEFQVRSRKAESV